jgi:mono/diheme cytochrome c family protein
VRLALLVTLLAAGLLAAGCGSSGGGISSGDDLSTGRALFNDPDVGCGNCHTLAAAGSSGTIGPNLDDAFRGAREQGFAEVTFEQVVREQIAYPSIGGVMPPDLVTGDDADDVAYFVSRCAANERDAACRPQGGGEITASEGDQIFAQAGCGGCHTLAAAGTSGTIGPNLDEARPSVELAVDRVTNGQGAMPAFGDRLSEEQIRAVAEYVAQGAGG